MDASGAWLFFASLITLAITPGVGALVVVDTTVRYGWRLALFTIVGIVSADYVFVLAVFFGLNALLGSFTIVLALLQWFGVGYIAFLGLQLLFFTSRQTHQVATSATTQKASWFKQYCLGLVVTLGNPKAIIYYSSIMPIVIGTDMMSLSQLVWILLLVTIAIVGVMLMYAFVAHKTHSTGIANAHTRLIQKCSGIALLFTACLLALHVLLASKKEGTFDSVFSFW